jgi:hypothetical protein
MKPNELMMKDYLAEFSLVEIGLSEVVDADLRCVLRYWLIWLPEFAVFHTVKHHFNRNGRSLMKEKHF